MFHSSGGRGRCLSFLAPFALLSLALGGCKAKFVSDAIIREPKVDGHQFAVADVDLSQTRLRLYWKRTDGTRIGTFNRLNAFVAASGDQLVFATNAGIFDAAFSPCGLYVEDGRELVPINLKMGTGNFYLKPNGVFFIDDRGAAIIESGAYHSFSIRPRLATQSGPLLLVGGHINPGFAIDSGSRRIRSGVGVISPAHVAFVISRDRVTFYEFAHFF